MSSKNKLDSNTVSCKDIETIDVYSENLDATYFHTSNLSSNSFSTQNFNKINYVSVSESAIIGTKGIPFESGVTGMVKSDNNTTIWGNMNYLGSTFTIGQTLYVNNCIVNNGITTQTYVKVTDGVICGNTFNILTGNLSATNTNLTIDGKLVLSGSSGYTFSQGVNIMGPFRAGLMSIGNTFSNASLYVSGNTFSYFKSDSSKPTMISNKHVNVSGEYVQYGGVTLYNNLLMNNNILSVSSNPDGITCGSTLSCSSGNILNTWTASKGVSLSGDISLNRLNVTSDVITNSVTNFNNGVTFGGLDINCSAVNISKGGVQINGTLDMINNNVTTKDLSLIGLYVNSQVTANRVNNTTSNGILVGDNNINCNKVFCNELTLYNYLSTPNLSFNGEDVIVNPSLNVNTLNITSESVNSYSFFNIGTLDVNPNSLNNGGFLFKNNTSGSTAMQNDSTIYVNGSLNIGNISNNGSTVIDAWAVNVNNVNQLTGNIQNGSQPNIRQLGTLNSLTLNQHINTSDAYSNSYVLKNSANNLGLSNNIGFFSDNSNMKFNYMSDNFVFSTSGTISNKKLYSSGYIFNGQDNDFGNGMIYKNNLFQLNINNNNLLQSSGDTLLINSDMYIPISTTTFSNSQNLYNVMNVSNDIYLKKITYETYNNLSLTNHLFYYDNGEYKIKVNDNVLSINNFFNVNYTICSTMSSLSNIEAFFIYNSCLSSDVTNSLDFRDIYDKYNNIYKKDIWSDGYTKKMNIGFYNFSNTVGITFINPSGSTGTTGGGFIINNSFVTTNVVSYSNVKYIDVVSHPTNRNIWNILFMVDQTNTNTYLNTITGNTVSNGLIVYGNSAYNLNVSGGITADVLGVKKLDVRGDLKIGGTFSCLNGVVVNPSVVSSNSVCSINSPNYQTINYNVNASNGQTYLNINNNVVKFNLDTEITNGNVTLTNKKIEFKFGNTFGSTMQVVNGDFLINEHTLKPSTLQVNQQIKGITLESNIITNSLVMSPTQTSITSVGKLDYLSVTGNASSDYTESKTKIQAQNILGTISNTNSNQDSIIQVGNLTQLNVTGNIVCDGNLVCDGITGNGLSITSSLITANQPNITRLGKLTSLTVNGDFSITGVSGNSFTVTSSNFDAKNIRSNVSRNIQTNVNKVGTLDSLNTVGNITVTNGDVNIFGNINTPSTQTNHIFGKVSSSASNQENMILNTGTAVLDSLNTTGDFVIQSENGNLTVSNYIESDTIEGTVTVNSQPNIKKLGTVTDMTVGDISVNSNMTVPSISIQDISGVLKSPLQTNITSVGTLNDVRVAKPFVFQTTTPNVHVLREGTTTGIKMNTNDITFKFNNIDVLNINASGVTVGNTLQCNSNFFGQKIRITDSSVSNSYPHIVSRTDADSPPNTGLNFSNNELTFISNGNVIGRLNTNLNVNTSVGHTATINKIVLTGTPNPSFPQINTRLDSATPYDTGINIYTDSIQTIRDGITVFNVTGTTNTSPIFTVAGKGVFTFIDVYDVYGGTGGMFSRSNVSVTKDGFNFNLLSINSGTIDQISVNNFSESGIGHAYFHPSRRIRFDRNNRSSSGISIPIDSVNKYVYNTINFRQLTSSSTTYTYYPGLKMYYDSETKSMQFYRHLGSYEPGEIKLRSGDTLHMEFKKDDKYINVGKKRERLGFGINRWSSGLGYTSQWMFGNAIGVGAQSTSLTGTSRGVSSIPSILGSKYIYYNFQYANGGGIIFPTVSNRSILNFNASSISSRNVLPNTRTGILEFTVINLNPIQYMVTNIL